MISLIHDDCTNVLSHIIDQSIDLIVTNPPYGISFDSGKNKYFGQIKNDNNIPLGWIKESYRILKDNSAIYIFCHWKTWGPLFDEVSNCGFSVKNMIVLNKSNHGMGDLKGQYAPKHELLMYASKGRHILNFPHKRMNDVWDVPIKFTKSHRYHQNEKPYSWIEPCIINSSKEGDTVLDPFMGSGTTMVVCQKINRNGIGIEIDEQYINIARTRINDKDCMRIL